MLKQAASAVICFCKLKNFMFHFMSIKKKANIMVILKVPSTYSAHLAAFSLHFYFGSGEQNVAPL